MLPAFRLPTSREHPHAKVEPYKTKKRFHKTNFEKWEGDRLEKYGKNLQEKTLLGRIFYPSFRKIGERTGMSPNTVRKYITQLEDKHLIDVEPTKV